MTYTASTTWTTTSVARVKADHVVVYRKPDGREDALDAGMVLIQQDGRGGRRTILGVVDTNTCEVIAAPDVPGYIRLIGRYLWDLSVPVTVSY